MGAGGPNRAEDEDALRHWLGPQYRRKNLQRLLALVQDYQVAEVVVTFSDRLTRFGLSYFQRYFSGYGVTLTVLDPDDEKTPEQELTDDVLALIASYAGRLYGLRSRKQKALLSCARQVLKNRTTSYGEDPAVLVSHSFARLHAERFAAPAA